ncbi:hypothetical protein [Scytonema sp. PRP1]|uniref:hypothetical protein n=1 Tax=Scytonema sp. PRP1 TaxID=3120513 RepID=UPI002FD3B1A8
MNNFAKAVLVALVFAAPVALSVPSVQAKTATPAKTTTVAAKPAAGTKATKTHYKNHHGKHKASHTQSSVKK